MHTNLVGKPEQKRFSESTYSLSSSCCNCTKSNSVLLTIDILATCQSKYRKVMVQPKLKIEGHKYYQEQTQAN
jgi:hypothetical protein